MVPDLDKLNSKENSPEGENTEFTPEESESDTERQVEAVEEKTENASRSYYLLRIVFEESRFNLEKGRLEQGVLRFAKVAEGQLPTEFSPILIESKEEAELLISDIKELTASWLKANTRLSIVLPDNWGVMLNVPHPGELPPEELARYLAWTVKINGWEDFEPFRFNVSAPDENQMVVVAVRERIFNFVERIARTLNAELVQLSLKRISDVNIISRENRPREALEESSPAEDDEFESFGPKVSPKAYLIPAAVVAVIVIVYLAASMLELNLPLLTPRKTAPPDSAALALDETSKTDSLLSGTGSIIPPDEIQPKTVSPDSVIASGCLLAKTIDLLQANGGLTCFSITGANASLEMEFASSGDISRLKSRMSKTVSAASTAETKAKSKTGKTSAILEFEFASDPMAGFVSQPADKVREVIQRSGYALNDDIFTGAIDQCRSLMELVEKRKIAFYRITLNRIGPDRYRMKLEL